MVHLQPMTHPLVQIYKDYEDNPGMLRLAVDGLTEAVARSYRELGGPRTQDEIKRRTETAAKWFVSLRHELGWSTPRAVDETYGALRAELNGDVYTPPRMDKQSWVGHAPGPELIWVPE